MCITLSLSKIGVPGIFSMKMLWTVFQRLKVWVWRIAILMQHQFKGQFIHNNISNVSEYDQYDADKIIQEFYETYNNKKSIDEEKQQQQQLKNNRNNNNNNNKHRDSTNRKQGSQLLYGVEYIESMRETSSLSPCDDAEDISTVNPIGKKEARSAFVSDAVYYHFSKLYPPNNVIIISNNNNERCWMGKLIMMICHHRHQVVAPSKINLGYLNLQ
jgi:hypothetical protein